MDGGSASAMQTAQVGGDAGSAEPIGAIEALGIQPA